MTTRSSAPRGPDVASWQGYPAWDQVALGGHAFAFTKATGGAWYVNPSLAYNWRSIKAAGLQRGAYHYAFESSGQPLPGPGPEAEADFFCDQLAPLGLDTGDMVVLDIEEGPGGNLSGWVLSWCRRVEERLRVRPLIYTGKWFSDPHGFPTCPELADYALWLAAYTSTIPQPPAPWPVVSFWQYTADAQVGGIDGPCDMNVFNGSLDRLPLMGYQPGTTPEPEPEPEPPAEDLPVYDPAEPAQVQDWDWDCSQQSASWMLYSYGRTPDDDWMENSLIAEGVVTPQHGLLDASGAGMADWLNRHYGPAYHASNDADASFDEVAAEAASMKHPTMIGGRGWYHWSGCRGYDSASGCLLLANPAPGYQGIGQTMTRSQFAQLGPFSLVRLTYPAAEGEGGPPPDVQPEPEPPLPDYGPGIGSGLVEMLTADGTEPAMTHSVTFGQPWQVELVFGKNGVLYVWLMGVGGFRYRPDP